MIRIAVNTLAAAYCCLLFVSSSTAAELENCDANYSGVTQIFDRMSCLYKNEVLINSVLEKTIAELRKDVQDLQSDVANLKAAATQQGTIIQNLQSDVTTLKSDVSNLKSDADNSVHWGSTLILQSRYSALHKCIWQPDFDNVNAVNCDPHNWWRIDRGTD